MTVKAGTNGMVDIYNNAGAQVIVDIFEYFVGDPALLLGGFYHPTDSPVRLLDTCEGGVPVPAHAPCT